MDITFLGHSSFRIKSKTAILITDPFDSEMVGLKFKKTEADIVTVSHDHKDHNKTDLVENVKMVIDAPGEYEINEVSIIGYPTYHDEKDGEKRGRNTIFLIEAEGIKVLHMGDIGHTLDKKLVEAFGDVDVLMIPVGGEYTVDAKKAIEITNEIEPSYVLPMHYQMEGLKKETFEKLVGVDDYLKGCGYDVEKLDKLNLKKELIDLETTKVVVLSRK